MINLEILPQESRKLQRLLGLFQNSGGNPLTKDAKDPISKNCNGLKNYG